MSGDDLAARLYAEQGYFIVSSMMMQGKGSVIRLSNKEKVETPMRVLGIAEREKYLAQCVLAHNIAPEIATAAVPFRQGPFYFYVEAAD